MTENIPAFDEQMEAIIGHFAWDEYVKQRTLNGYAVTVEEGKRLARRLLNRCNSDCGDADYYVSETANLRASVSSGWFALEVVTHCDLDARDIFGWPEDDDGAVYRRWKNA